YGESNPSQVAGSHPKAGPGGRPFPFARLNEEDTMSNPAPNVAPTGLAVHLCRFLGALEAARQHGDALLDLLDAHVPHLPPRPPPPPRPGPPPGPPAPRHGAAGTPTALAPVGRLAANVRAGQRSLEALYASVHSLYDPRPPHGSAVQPDAIADAG